jgi:NADPH2:quinone reductase
MFAHRVVDYPGAAAVHWTRVEEPAADGGVVIDVVAAGVSFADLLKTTGAYQLKAPLPFTRGVDAAGVVRSARPDLGLAVGQRVAVLLSHGCWQEVISAPAERVLALPDDLSLTLVPVGATRSVYIPIELGH